MNCKEWNGNVLKIEVTFSFIKFRFPILDMQTSHILHLFLEEDLEVNYLLDLIIQGISLLLMAVVGLQICHTDPRVRRISLQVLHIGLQVLHTAPRVLLIAPRVLHTCLLEVDHLIIDLEEQSLLADMDLMDLMIIRDLTDIKDLMDIVDIIGLMDIVDALIEISHRLVVQDLLHLIIDLQEDKE